MGFYWYYIMVRYMYRIFGGILIWDIPLQVDKVSNKVGRKVCVCVCVYFLHRRAVLPVVHTP